VEFTGMQVSVAAYDVLWDSVLPGRQKPAVLHCASPGDTAERRDHVVREARTELQRAGYAGPREASEEAAATLDCLARPRLAVDVRRYEWVHGEHGPVLAKVGARVAVTAWRGAVALLGQDWFQAWSFPVTSLVNEVVRLFVPHDPPARFQGVALYPDQLEAKFRPARRQLSETTLQLMEGPFLRRADICVLSRDHFGGGERVAESLVLNDIAAGRYLVFKARNQITITPGDRGTLERKLKELINAIRQH
jgi:hypothetical protein